LTTKINTPKQVLNNADQVGQFITQSSKSPGNVDQPVDTILKICTFSLSTQVFELYRRRRGKAVFAGVAPTASAGATLLATACSAASTCVAEPANAAGVVDAPAAGVVDAPPAEAAKAVAADAASEAKAKAAATAASEAPGAAGATGAATAPDVSSLWLERPRATTAERSERLREATRGGALAERPFR